MNLTDKHIKKPKYKIIDLFAGAGGLSNGFEQTGRFEVIGAVEINRAAVKTYIKNHGDNESIIIKPKGQKVSDISKINFIEFLREQKITGANTIVIGGPPCQGFSRANRQKNYLISGNNQLVKEFVRAIEEIQPIAFLMENVETMDSEIHKFFVTEHIDNTKFAYSSEVYLSQITQFEDGLLKPFWKNDSISLVATKYSELENIFNTIIQTNLTSPVIESETFISRLRSITRKATKLSHLQLQTDKEKKELSQLVDYLETKLRTDTSFEQLNIKPIISRAVNVLQKIKDTKTTREEILTNIEPFMDLNQFLMHYQEIIDEKIILNKLPEVKKISDKFQVIADVKSYNVVEYLKHVFAYFGYKTDAKVLTASNFGVPQRRNRFMILGIREEVLSEEKVELPEEIPNFSKLHTTFDAIGDLESISPQHDIETYKPESYADKEPLTALQCYYRVGNVRGEIYNHINTKSKELSLKRFEAIKESGGKNFHSLPEELKTTYANAARTQNTVYRRLKYDEPSPTVVNIRKSMWNHPENAVALSIREAARLQSFRDNFIFYGSKDQQYQQVGNAVPPLMARGVAEKILKILGDKPEVTIEEELNKQEKSSC